MSLTSLTPFEFLILITIFANCIALAVYKPYPKADSNNVNATLVSVRVILEDLVEISQWQKCANVLCL